MVPFHQWTITDPFCVLLFDLDNCSQFHFWDITSHWCHSAVTTNSYLNFFISSHLDLLSPSPSLPSTFQCHFLIMVVTKSRVCLDYNKFVLKILESHLAFCLVTLPEPPAFSLIFIHFLVFVSLSSSFVSFFQLCRFLLALLQPLYGLISWTHTICDNKLPWTC